MTNKTEKELNKVEGFVIENIGDSSVGIEPAIYEIKGPFFFKNEEQKEFESLLLTAFETICDPARIRTFEDIDEEIKTKLDNYISNKFNCKI